MTKFNEAHFMKKVFGVWQKELTLMAVCYLVLRVLWVVTWGVISSI